MNGRHLVNIWLCINCGPKTIAHELFIDYEFWVDLLVSRLAYAEKFYGNIGELVSGECKTRPLANWLLVNQDNDLQVPE